MHFYQVNLEYIFLNDNSKISKTLSSYCFTTYWQVLKAKQESHPEHPVSHSKEGLLIVLSGGWVFKGNISFFLYDDLNFKVLSKTTTKLHWHHLPVFKLVYLLICFKINIYRAIHALPVHYYQYFSIFKNFILDNGSCIWNLSIPVIFMDLTNTWLLKEKCYFLKSQRNL